LPYIFQVASAVCLIACVNGGLVSYLNGAVVPYDPANQAATAAHLASKGYLGYGAIGYNVHPVHQIWKRSADPSLVAYPNGALVPYDGANQAATAAHLAYKGHLGYAGVYGYPAVHQVYGVLPVTGVPLVAHPNGAAVPLEPAAVSFYKILK